MDFMSRNQSSVLFGIVFGFFFVAAAVISWAQPLHDDGSFTDSGTPTNGSPPPQERDLDEWKSPPWIPPPPPVRWQAPVEQQPLSGNVVSWGSNGYGQLGDGGKQSRAQPQTISITDVRMVAGDLVSGWAVKFDGSVWAWGICGTQGPYPEFVPVPIKSISDVQAISRGNGFTLALKRDGTVWSWGYNQDANAGVLGNGSETDNYTPARVAGLSDVVAISAGMAHSMALKKDGSVWVWGSNYFGQLGNKTLAKSLVPVQVKSLREITAIAAGSEHCVALQKDGTVWVWGNTGCALPLRDNTFKQLRRIEGLSDVTSIAAGNGMSYAIQRDGSAWAWGAFANGELCEGKADDEEKPVRIRGLTGVRSISGGHNISLAIKDDGTVWAWDSTDQKIGGWTKPVGKAPAQIQALSNATSAAACHGFALVVVRDALTIPDKR
jgi:alpha-tubulin suppressor-like RCC1 family protein